MSERRKPDIILVAEKRGNRRRLELFRSEQWPERYKNKPGRYRVRANGRWVRTKPEVFTLTYITDSLRRWLSRK